MTGHTAAGPRPIALVTGGSRGIGRAVVARLARDGYDLAFCYRSAGDAAAEAAKEAAEEGARVLAREVDVADSAACRQFVTDTEQELGPISAVVSCAGVTRDRPLVRMQDEEWRQVLSTNLDGTFHICRAAVFPMMKRRAGCLVTMSSVAGVHGSPTQANYSASKAGIIGLTLALAKEYGRYGVRANVVAPGFITTDMTAALSEDAKKRYLERIPLARYGTPQDVADAVSYLVSDRAAYVTGQILGVNGGLVV